MTRRGAEGRRVAAVTKASADGDFIRVANLLGAEEGAPPLPIQAYSVVLRACVKHGEGQFAAELLRHLRREYPDLLDTQAYNLAIRACGVSRDWRMAAEVFAELKAEAAERSRRLPTALGPDEYTYNTLLYALAAGRQPALAEEVVAEMVSSGVGVSDYAASALITAHANASTGGASPALDAARRMTALGAVESVHTFNAVIRACAKHAEWDKALYVYSRMQRSSVQPNEYTHRLILRVARAGVLATESAQLTAALASAGVAAAGALGCTLGLL